MMKQLCGGAALIWLLSGCLNCKYLGDHPVIITHTGQQICARHHIPLVTVRGYADTRPQIRFYDSVGEALVVDYCNPNGVPPDRSLVRTAIYSKPAPVTYCRLCQQAVAENRASPDPGRPPSWWRKFTTNIYPTPQ